MSDNAMVRLLSGNPGAIDRPMRVGPQYPMNQGEPIEYNHNDSLEEAIESFAPELLLAAGAMLDVPRSDRARMLPGTFFDQYPNTEGSLTLVSADYPVAGPVGQAKMCVKTVAAMGRHNTISAIAATDGQPDPTFTSTFAAPAPLILGVEIDWGVAVAFYAPVDLTITVSGFSLADAAITGYASALQRNVTLRACNRSGGRIFLPALQRYNSPGSMTIAQHAVAYIPQGPGLTVAIGPIPGAVGNYFSATTRLLTAHSPYTALYSSILGLWTGRTRLTQGCGLGVGISALRSQ